MQTSQRPSSGDAAAAATDLLAELTAGLAAGDDLRGLLLRFLEPIVHIAGAAAGGVRVLDSRDRTMHLIGQLGLPGTVSEAERRVEDSCGVCGAAIAAEQLLWSEDLQRCARRSSGEFFGQACHRMLAVPLQHHGQVLGLLNLFFTDPMQPSSQVQCLLKTIGELLGLALDNARLERETLRSVVIGERQALAAELHDSLGQCLSSVKMRLPLLQDAIEAGDRSVARRYFDDVRGAVAEAHAALRGILSQFRVPIDPLGLSHALQARVDAFRRETSTTLQFENHLPGLRLAPDDELQVLLIVREALANIARHARAKRAWLKLASTRSRVRVSVEDDGVGVEGGSLRGGDNHFGLQIMSERAQRVRGTLSIGRRPGGGTRVQLEFPLPSASLGAIGLGGNEDSR